MRTIDTARSIRRLRQFGRRLLYPREPVWSIGVYLGASPLALAESPSIRNPVLRPTDVTDVPAKFVADPFMLRTGGAWHMFFEVFNRESAKGEIGLACSQDGATWSYEGIVLAEPFHLSYPYVFEHDGTVYMVPENKEHCVGLYAAVDFPRQWSLIAKLLEGGCFADASMFRHEGTWWMFAETSEGFKSDTLRLFCARDLLGPWREHPRSPIIAGNPHIARPAGRVLPLNGGILRFAQDDYPVYGRQVSAFEITELGATRYQEHPVATGPVLSPSGIGWNARGMHNVDAHPTDDGQWIACVDGLGARPRAEEAR
jgi:hypothetical protein